MLSFVFLALAGTPAKAAPKVNISEQLVREKAGCVDYLVKTVEQGLLSLHSPEATVNLGEYDELENLLIKAGVDRRDAKQAVNAVTEVHAASFNYPALRFTASVFDDLVAHKKILICTISKKCSLAQAGANFMLFTEQHEGIVVMPPPLAGAQRFAMNLFSSLGTSAGERVLTAWLHAGYNKQERKLGSADDLYREFASRYDGAQPPNPSSLDQGFIVTFMTLFQMQVAENIYRIYDPANSDFNHAHLASHVFDDLMVGRNRAITAATMRKLEIRESNIFRRTEDILKTMIGTIESAP